MKIDNYISELLYDHDCVIITDLGGIIANYKPASINAALHVINPPSKQLAFNAALKHNDGLLANHLAQRAAMNYTDAGDVIREYVKEALKNLKNGQKLKIEKVGVLYLDNETNLQFVPDQNANYLISSFGLPAIHSPLIKRDVQLPEETHAAKVIPFPVSDQKSTKDRKPFKWKVIEVIPAAAVLAFLFMVPPVLNEFNNNLSTLLPFSRINEYIHNLKGESVDRPFTIEYKSPFMVPPSNPNIYNYNKAAADAKSVEPEMLPKSTEKVVDAVVSEPSVSINNTVAPAPLPVTVEVENKTYFVIGGCFRSKENADKFIAEMKAKGSEAELIGQNNAGLYMVSLFSSPSYVQTTDALPEIKSGIVESAWIYKK